MVNLLFIEDDYALLSKPGIFRSLCEPFFGWHACGFGGPRIPATTTPSVLSIQKQK